MKVAVIIEQFDANNSDSTMSDPVVMRWDGPDHEALQRKVIKRYSDILLEHLSQDPEVCNHETDREEAILLERTHGERLKEAIDRDFAFEWGGYRLTMSLVDVEELE